MGVVSNTHYCGDKAVKSSLAIGISELSCGMVEMESSLCDSHNEHYTIHNQNCCKNKHAQFSITGEYDNLISVCGEFVLKFIPPFTLNHIYKYGFDMANLVAVFSNLSPPIQKNISILYQVFRI